MKPGQLWSWSFEVGDGTWFVSTVTPEARNAFDRMMNVMIRRGDTFLVITTDDEGPYEHSFHKTIGSRMRSKEWFVALLNGTLVWMETEWFRGRSAGELVTDV